MALPLPAPDPDIEPEITIAPCPNCEIGNIVIVPNLYDGVILGYFCACSECSENYFVSATAAFTRMKYG